MYHLSSNTAEWAALARGTRVCPCSRRRDAPSRALFLVEQSAPFLELGMTTRDQGPTMRCRFTACLLRRVLLVPSCCCLATSQRVGHDQLGSGNCGMCRMGSGSRDAGICPSQRGDWHDIRHVPVPPSSPINRKKPVTAADAVTTADGAQPPCHRRSTQAPPLLSSLPSRDQHLPHQLALHDAPRVFVGRHRRREHVQ